MRKLAIYLVGFSMVLCSFANNPIRQSGPKIDYTPVQTFPVFVSEVNEVEIADLMNDVDPTLVLASFVNMQTGLVSSLDNCLSSSAEPIINSQPEVLFKDIIENSLVASASWLSFLEASVNTNVKAEVSVTKTKKATIKNSDIDRGKLDTLVGRIPQNQRANYGLIIGYIDFVLSATTFKDFGAAGKGSGFGVRIDGKWYSKFETTSANHRVIAIWSPLPFIVDSMRTPAAGKVSLEELTKSGINRGVISPTKIKSIKIPRRK
jgi:hypothetical protein